MKEENYLEPNLVDVIDYIYNGKQFFNNISPDNRKILDLAIDGLTRLATEKKLTAKQFAYFIHDAISGFEEDLFDEI